jgi:hypothetical protein
MKTMPFVAACAGLAFVMMFGTPRAYAQAEVDPDHYDTPEAPASQPTRANTAHEAAQVHYEGSFLLPHSLQCNGKHLAPGKYSLSLSSDGKTTRLMLNRKGQVLHVEGVTQQHSRNQEQNALIVKRSGTINRLAMIHLADFDFFVGPAPKLEPTTSGAGGRVEKLPLILAESRKVTGTGRP